MTSLHYREDRKEREAFIRNIGNGKIVDRFLIDRHHKNGAEVHCVTSTGIIIIFNAKTHKLITKIIANPNQIKRYYKDGNAPKEIIEKARENKRMKRGRNI